VVEADAELSNVTEEATLAEAHEENEAKKRAAAEESVDEVRFRPTTQALSSYGGLPDVSLTFDQVLMALIESKQPKKPRKKQQVGEEGTAGKAPAAPRKPAPVSGGKFSAGGSVEEMAVAYINAEVSATLG
jgi:hypothetical protein